MHNFIPIISRLRNQGFNLLAGIDEAGRGPLAGPVVSAAVILKEDVSLPGLNDSKLLSAKKRLELFNLILANCLDYAIAVVPHQIIDNVNILNAVRTANFLCIKSLKIKPHLILIDGKDKQFLKKRFKTVIQGDSRIECIAAASILAKVTRDAIMNYYHAQYPEYAFNEHVGYATRKHYSKIERYGLCDIHRKSFSYANCDYR